MDIIAWVKTLLIGYFGAGGFYVIVSFCYLYFPLPLFAKLQTLLSSWAAGRHKKKGNTMAKLWYLGIIGLIALMGLAWAATFGLYAYTVYIMLLRYVTTDMDIFWFYYVVATIFPAIWAIYRWKRFFREKEVEVEEDDSGKTLLERMMG